jgi:hypothetical protein
MESTPLEKPLRPVQLQLKDTSNGQQVALRDFYVDFREHVPGLFRLLPGSFKARFVFLTEWLYRQAGGAQEYAARCPAHMYYTIVELACILAERGASRKKQSLSTKSDKKATAQGGFL